MSSPRIIPVPRDREPHRATCHPSTSARSVVSIVNSLFAWYTTAACIHQFDLPILRFRIPSFLQSLRSTIIYPYREPSYTPAVNRSGLPRLSEHPKFLTHTPQKPTKEPTAPTSSRSASQSSSLQTTPTRKRTRSPRPDVLAAQGNIKIAKRSNRLTSNILGDTAPPRNLRLSGWGGFTAVELATFLPEWLRSSAVMFRLVQNGLTTDILNEIMITVTVLD